MAAQKKKPLAVITGASGYVGSAIASEFVLKGWQVAALSRHACKAAGVTSFECDVTDENAVLRAIEKIVGKYGDIQACIHAAAAALERVPILSTSPASFDSTIKVALYAAYYLASAAAPHMPKGSVFIGITTEAIEPGAGSAPLGAYVPGKLALRGFLRALATTEATQGIRVHAVAPGFLPGGLNSDMPDAVLDFLAKKNKNEPSVSDVGALVAKICADPRAFENGTSIRVRGETVTSL
jgi:3-oxoacyl-[acyl-carrier protein] reductase